MIAGDGDSRHGTLGGYVNQKCRCDECRAANAAYGRAYRAKTREHREAQDRALSRLLDDLHRAKFDRLYVEEENR